MIVSMTPTGIKPRLFHSSFKDASYEFKAGVNLLVGANGSGKSSLLHAMRPSNSKGLCDVVLERPEGMKNEVIFFDFEKDNPRVKSFAAMMDEGSFGAAGLASFMDAHAVGRSHGEMQRALLTRLEKVLTPTTILFLDEPEQALDHLGMALLKEMLERWPSRQVFIATHSPFLIFSKYHVIELTVGYIQSMRESLHQALGGDGYFQGR